MSVLQHSRRRFIAGAVPALAALSHLPRLEARVEHEPGNEQNAANYAQRVLSTDPRVLNTELPDRVPVVGYVYGLAATLEDAKGSPRAVAFVKGHPDRKHMPILWAFPSSVEEEEGISPEDLAMGVTAWSLSGKYVWFEGPDDGLAQNIESSAVLHPWQDKKYVPRLNEIAQGTRSVALDALETHSSVSAMLKLNRGRIETGVPFREIGRSGLFQYPANAPVGAKANVHAGRAVRQLSDNQMWSFWLPEDQRTVRIWYRDLGQDPSQKCLLAVLKATGNQGISFVFSNDVDPRVTHPIQLGHSDARHYWEITNKSTNTGAPLFNRSVYGPRSHLLVGDSNDCDEICTRVRILLP